MNYFQNIFYLLFLTILTVLIIKVNAVNDKKQDAKCLLPMEPGPCRMSLNRFYYNAQTDTCEEFKFGGCRGNDNKFGFKQTCEEACKKSTTSGTSATSTVATTGEKKDLNSKQLNINTLKTLTTANDGTTSTTTTPKPKVAGTTVNSKVTTTRTKSSPSLSTTTPKTITHK